MSKQNKVNKNNYDQAGRLTPDEIGRERMNQDRMAERPKNDNVTEKIRPGGRESSRPRSVPEE